MTPEKLRVKYFEMCPARQHRWNSCTPSDPCDVCKEHVPRQVKLIAELLRGLRKAFRSGDEVKHVASALGLGTDGASRAIAEAVWLSSLARSMAHCCARFWIVE